MILLNRHENPKGYGYMTLDNHRYFYHGFGNATSILFHIVFEPTFLFLWLSVNVLSIQYIISM